jgi:galactose mutarotase-like enzyme
MKKYFSMKTSPRNSVSLAALLVLALVTLTSGCKSKPAPPEPTPTQAASANLPDVGGQKAIELRRKQSGTGAKPEFLSVTLLPGRGMNVFQITAYLPGKGEVPLLASPPIADAAKILDGGPDDFHGNKSFSMGGAILFPFANRIRGPVTKDAKTGARTISLKWHGRTARLAANWHGKNPGADWVAMHGDMLDANAQSVSVQETDDGAETTAVYELPLKDEWFASNRVKVHVQLARDTVTLAVTATDTGKHDEPVGIGWHPYFRLPSGARANARLHLPATMRAKVNNYDDVFPTGELVAVEGTPYDFTHAEGAPLPDQLMDDSFVDLKRDAVGDAVAEIRDFGANYGMRITAMTPKVRAFQVYSPADKPYIALEPQFNYNDPFGSEWHATNTGMVTLKPGESVTWKVQLQLFQPSEDMVGVPPHPPIR